MLSAFIAILGTAYLARAAAYETQGQPGKFAIWHSASNGEQLQPSYRTQTMYHTQIVQHVQSVADGAEAVVFLTYGGKSTSLPMLTYMKESIDSSSGSTIFPNVYDDKLEASAETSAVLSRVLLDSPVFKGSREVTPDQLVQMLHADGSALMRNGKVDSFVVKLTGIAADDTKAMAALSDIKGLYLMTSQDSKTAIAPSRTGKYNRLLADSTSTTVQNSIYYKPEGAEYSIYYANTYLYMTPDLFTGTLTGVFFFFVILTGLSCLGSVLGPVSFVHKGPAVGREV